jgi:hypothetical protein
MNGRSGRVPGSLRTAVLEFHRPILSRSVQTRSPIWGGVFWHRAMSFRLFRGNKPPSKGISAIARLTRIRNLMNLFGPSGIYYL